MQINTKGNTVKVIKSTGTTLYKNLPEQIIFHGIQSLNFHSTALMLDGPVSIQTWNIGK